MIGLWQDAYERWRPEFAKVIDADLYPLAWLDERLRTRDAMFDFTEKAAIVSEYRFYPSGKMELHGLVAAGDLDEITGILIPFVVSRARDSGAIYATIESRDAWVKLLQDQGFERHQQIVRKAL